MSKLTAIDYDPQVLRVLAGVCYLVAVVVLARAAFAAASHGVSWDILDALKPAAILTYVGALHSSLARAKEKRG